MSEKISPCGHRKSREHNGTRCFRYHGREVLQRCRVFGSIAKGIDCDGSDVDLLVDMPPGTSLLKIVALQIELEDALDVKVDLGTEPDLPAELLSRVLAEAHAI